MSKRFKWGAVALLSAALSVVFAGACGGPSRDFSNMGGSAGSGAESGTGATSGSSSAGTSTSGGGAVGLGGDGAGGVPLNTGTKLLAEKCASGDECESGHCADGVCCNAACEGACEACNLDASPGKCSPSSAGDASPDGHPACAKEEATSCGTDGTCDGAAACRLYQR